MNLHEASRCMDLTAVCRELAAGGDPNGQDEMGWTPTARAIATFDNPLAELGHRANDRVGVLCALLAAGGCAYACHPYTGQPLMKAISRKTAELVELITHEQRQEAALESAASMQELTPFIGLGTQVQARL